MQYSNDLDNKSAATLLIWLKHITTDLLSKLLV